VFYIVKVYKNTTTAIESN